MLAFSIVYGIAFWVVISVYMAAFVPLVILKSLGLEREAHHYLGAISRIIAKFLLFSTGTTLYIEGRSNIPRGKPYCYIGNHQAYADILAMMAATPEAVFVSMIDNLDARMGMVQRALRTAPEGDEFTERLLGLEAPLLLRKLPD